MRTTVTPATRAGILQRPLVSQAQLAAPAIGHGATVLNFDADCARFAGLRFSHLR